MARRKCSTIRISYLGIFIAFIDFVFFLPIFTIRFGIRFSIRVFSLSSVIYASISFIFILTFIDNNNSIKKLSVRVFAF